MGTGYEYSSYRVSIAATALISLIFPLMTLVPAKANVPLETIGGFSIIEGNDGYGAPRTNLKAEIDRVTFAQFPCKGVTDPSCVGKYLSPAAYLLPCSESVTVACVVEVYALSSSGEKINAEYIRSIGHDPEIDFNEVPAIKLATGEGVGGLWKFPGLMHEGSTDTYAIQARISGWMTEDRSRINYNSAFFGIAAVRQQQGNFLSYFFDVDEQGRFKGYSGGSSECVMAEIGSCYQRTNLPTGYKFGMKVKIPNALSGWFHGRISQPQFTITNNSDGSYLYDVQAQPVTVPGVSKLIPYSSWTSEFRDYAIEQWPFSNGGGVLLPGNIGRLSMELTKRFLPMVEDKSTTSSSFWVVRTLDEWADGKIVESIDQKVKLCSTDSSKVSGIVTTNALIYSAGPPSFKEETQSLDYTVLSPHFDDKGAENLGTYDLLLDSTVARCIYGFSNAPIKAELEIIGSDGNSKVATTVLGERGNWLFLSANGFTFSEPTVRVKLTQPEVEKPRVIEPTPTPSSEVSTNQAANSSQPQFQKKSKRVTITCYRGSKSRNVTALKPKCPKGFRKA